MWEAHGLYCGSSKGCGQCPVMPHLYFKGLVLEVRGHGRDGAVITFIDQNELAALKASKALFAECLMNLVTEVSDEHATMIQQYIDKVEEVTEAGKKA